MGLSSDYFLIALIARLIILISRIAVFDACLVCVKVEAHNPTTLCRLSAEHWPMGTYEQLKRRNYAVPEIRSIKYTAGKATEVRKEETKLLQSIISFLATALNFLTALIFTARSVA